MKSIDWNVQDEWQPLEAVMVGIGDGMGPVPKLEETYDPQSRKHVQDGTYPLESDVTRELDAFVASMAARGIQLKRPEALGFNQVFARDIGVVIENAFIMTSMVEDREQEQAGTPGCWMAIRDRFTIRLLKSNWKAVTSCPCQEKFGSDVQVMRTSINSRRLEPIERQRNGSEISSRTGKFEYLSCRNPTAIRKEMPCTWIAVLLRWA